MFPFFVIGADVWLIQLLKYTNEFARHSKNKYHSKACYVLMKALDYPLSNASLFGSIIFKIIMSLCDVSHTKWLEIKKLLWCIWCYNTDICKWFLSICLHKSIMQVSECFSEKRGLNICANKH